MKKQYKWLAKDGRVYLLRLVVGLFGECWDCIGNFEDGGGNAERVREITRRLNECARHTENTDKDHD